MSSFFIGRLCLNLKYQLYTSSYDCTVRSLSFVSGTSKEIYANEEGNLISSIDLPPTGYELWISDNSGGVTHVDLRQRSSKSRRYGLSDHKIGTVSVNPTRTHFLLTASNSRLIKYVRYERGFMCLSFLSYRIWDTRRLHGIPVTLLDQAAQGTAADESTHGTIDFDTEVVNKYVGSTKGKSVVRADFPHGKSASSAYWDPRGRQIVSTSYDDRLRCMFIFGEIFSLSAMISCLSMGYRIAYLPDGWRIP